MIFQQLVGAIIGAADLLAQFLLSARSQVHPLTEKSRSAESRQGENDRDEEVSGRRVGGEWEVTDRNERHRSRETFLESRRERESLETRGKERRGERERERRNNERGSYL